MLCAIVALLATMASAEEIRGSSTNTILGRANDVIASDDNIVIGQGNSIQGKMLQQSTYIRTRYFGSASSDSASFTGVLGSDSFAGGATLSDTETSSNADIATSSTFGVGHDASSTTSTHQSQTATTAGGAGSVSDHQDTTAGAGSSHHGAAGGTNADDGAATAP